MPEVDFCLADSTLGYPPFAVLLDAAVAGGFAGLTLCPRRTYGRALDAGLTPGDVKLALEQHGLRVVGLDSLIAWTGPGDPGGPYFGEPTRDQLWQARDELDVSTINVVLLRGRTVERAQLIDSLAALAVEAEKHAAQLAVEFAPGTAVGTLADTLSVIDEVGSDRLGVTLDVWHHYVTTAPWDSTELPGADLVRLVQLCDAPDLPPKQLAAVTGTARLIPGDGIIDIASFLAMLRGNRVQAPIAVEILSPRSAQSDPVEYAREIGAACRRLPAVSVGQ
ncbi:MAG TPA: sugar phosphate isomerase/epimerase [Jatrophihabitans sp.]